MKRRIGFLVAVATLVIAGLAGPLTSAPASALTAPGVAATRLPVPADAAAESDPQINAISCGATGFCVAVGSYRILEGSSIENIGLIDTLSGGVWTAHRAPLPTGATGLVAGSLEGVSCGSATVCAAFGAYSTTSVTNAPMALSLSSGTWKATDVPVPTGGTFPAPGDSDPGISGVGCLSGGCALVGNFYTNAHAIRGWTAGLQGSTWTAPLITSTPNDATAQASWLHGVACGGSLCQAVGGYTSPVGWEPLVVSVDPAAGTSNSPSSHPNLPTGATEMSDLKGIACDSTGLCAAYGSYYTSGGSNEEALVMPVGGTPFQPQAPPTATAASTTIHPAAKIDAAGCAGGTCVLGGYYYDTSSTFHPLLDRFSTGGGTADTAPNGNIPSGVACGATTFCTGFTTSPYGQPIDVLTASGWVTAALVLPGDAVPGALSSALEDATACDSATSCWVAGTYSTNSGGAAFVDHVTPTAAAKAPTVSTSSMPSFALGSSTTFTWHGTAGSASIAHYTVQVRRAAWNGGFGSWTTPSGWGALSAATSHVAVPLPIGDDTCVRVEAVDTGALASGWSAPRCSTRPLDDHSLTASTGWKRASASGYYLGTYSSIKTYGATLNRTSAQFDRLALVATKCSTCGKVAIYAGSSLLATINLYRSTTLREVVIPLPAISLRTATVRLRVVTSGKSVVIDGLGISRS